LIDLLWDEGPLTQQEIAIQMQKDKNSITKLIDGLQRKGYVVRKIDSDDRRKNMVHVTAMGQGKKTGNHTHCHRCSRQDFKWYSGRRANLCYGGTQQVE